MSSRGGAGREERGTGLTFCITRILVGSKSKSYFLLNAGLGNEVQVVWLASDKASSGTLNDVIKTRCSLLSLASALLQVTAQARTGSTPWGQDACRSFKPHALSPQGKEPVCFAESSKCWN